MAQVNALQGDGELSDYVEARRRAWMEEYREERREEGRQEGREEELRNNQQLLAQVATRRFGPQVGQRLAKVLTDADDRVRFEQVVELIVDSADGKELLRGLDDKFS